MNLAIAETSILYVVGSFNFLLIFNNDSKIKSPFFLVHITESTSAMEQLSAR